MIYKKLSRRSFITMSALSTVFFALDWKKISAYAASMGPKKDYPTVIIGAGLGGLCCGAYLAKQNIPVTVVEQYSSPGGYATAFDRAGGKFTFEVSLHGMAARNNAAARILTDLGILERLELVQLPEIYRLDTPDLKITIPQGDPEAYIRLLTKHFPAEEGGIRDFVHEVVGIAEEADRLYRKGKFSKVLFAVQYPKMFKAHNKTLAELINKHIKDPALQTILASLWDFHGLPPSKVSALYYGVATGDSLKNGTYYIKLRSRDLSYGLTKLIESSGGQIIYETLVEKILVKNGAVEGVVLRGGKALPARAVVSNANALTTLKEMVPQEAMPPDYLKPLAGYRPSLSTFIVWLGLSKEVKGKIDGSGFQIASGRGPEADYQSCLKGEVEKIPFRVSVYDNIFDGYSKLGTSTLRIFCLTGYGPWRQFETDYRAGRKNAYHREKARWTNILIRRAEEKVVPGLSSIVDVKEAATPLTNWRFTQNVEGAIYGFEQSMDNAYIDRIDNRTPIKGLYLASAWSYPGGGFSSVLLGGQMTFRKMMADWGG